MSEELPDQETDAELRARIDQGLEARLEELTELLQSTEWSNVDPEVLAMLQRQMKNLSMALGRE